MCLNRIKIFFSKFFNVAGVDGFSFWKPCGQDVSDHFVMSFLVPHGRL